jgi:hypothetical protein
VSEPKFDEWALVELFGHQRIVGKVSEATLAGGAFLRVDVPQIGPDKAFTRFYGPSAIYAISPVTEEIARGLIAQHRHEPVSRFELPQIAEKVQENPLDGTPHENDEPNRYDCDMDNEND